MKHVLVLIIGSFLVSSTICQALQEEKVESTGDQSIQAEERQETIQLMRDRLSYSKAQFSIVGEVVKVAANTFQINGESFVVNSDTTIQGQFTAGVEAEVRGFIQAGKTKVADQITVFEQRSTSNPSTSATAQPTGMLGIKR